MVINLKDSVSKPIKTINKPASHVVSGSCQGEVCRVCSEFAAHKVAEEILHDDPGGYQEFQGLKMLSRHPYTAYLCCEHFQMVFGLSTNCKVG